VLIVESFVKTIHVFESTFWINANLKQATLKNQKILLYFVNFNYICASSTFVYAYLEMHVSRG